MSTQKNIVSGLQLAASAKAREAEGNILPFPPDGYPALPSVQGAAVLGYAIKTAKIREYFGPDGARRYPGDEGYGDALNELVDAGWLLRDTQAAGWQQRGCLRYQVNPRARPVAG